MPVYKDNNKKCSWFVSCYYTDYQGYRKQKLKRGFKTKRDAQAWERDFLDNLSSEPTMLFKNLVKLYLDDCSSRLKVRTYETMNIVLRTHILPYFGNMQLNKITSANIRDWQNNFKYNATTNKELSTSYKNYVYVTLSTVFNFACKYHNLSVNPCSKVSKLKNTDIKKMQFYTLDQYRLFRACIPDIKYKTVFDILFYCGLRIGELLALTFKDIDLENKTIDINKTLSMLYKKEIVTSPKTLSSIRVVALPEFLIDELKEYMIHCYDKDDNTRIFNMSLATIRIYTNRYSEAANLPHIRIHDFRHSHVALLVELGENPLLIANRLGHSDIKMTLNTYAHLYPNKQRELAGKLDNL